MHMISKKDLNSAELDTVTTSRSPMTVLLANCEVHTHQEATVYVKELEKSWQWKFFEDTPAVLSQGKLCDEHGYSYEWINGQKPHLIKNGIRVQCNTENFVPIVVPGLSTSSSSSLLSSTSMTPSWQEIDHPKSSSRSSTSPPMTSSTVSSESVDRQERRDPCGIDHHPAIVSSERVERQERGDPCHSDIPEWLQEFRENFCGWQSSWTQRLTRKFFSWIIFGAYEKCRFGSTQCLYSLGKDRNCDICQRTKITRAPCKRRIGRVVLCAEKFGDLITADRQVLSEGCESRNNHRFAVVVQDLATQWIQSYPCKTKTSQETRRNLQKFLEPNRNPKVIHTDNSLEFGKACEDLSWNHCTSTPHRSESHGIAEKSSTQSERRYVCSVVAIRSGWKMMCRLHGMLHLSAKCYRSLIWWENSVWETLWATT